MSDNDFTPVITKADAQQLKSVTNSEFKVITMELERRKDDLLGIIEIEGKQKEQAAREQYEVQEQATEDAAKAIRDTYRQKLMVHVEKLNKKMVADLKDLGVQFWEKRRYGAPGQEIEEPTLITGHASLDNVKYPAKQKLQTVLGKINNETDARKEQVNRDYREASFKLARLQQDQLVSLAGQSITTQAAQQFLQGLPKAENLLTAPESDETVG